MLAYFLLKESIKCFELIVLLLSLAAVLTFSLFEDTGGDSEEGAKTSIPMWLSYFLLALSPLLSSGGIIAMRKMKKFHEAVVSWYLNWMLLFSSTTMILILQ